ncbi:MAG: MltA domain-containing protein [Ahrensia sp.]|nr:MltA domain-containing protein [Ahrensia sp.]
MNSVLPPSDWEPCRFDNLPGWSADRTSAAFETFKTSLKGWAKGPPITKKFGSCGYKVFSLVEAANRLGDLSELEARRFFEMRFQPFRIAPSSKGKLTGYYEPVLPASLERTGPFQYPLYKRPCDLVDVADENRPAGMNSYFRFARKTPEGLVEYYDRGAIDQGALSNRGLELVWLNDRVDQFFVHVQGSARLKLPNGEQMRVCFDGKSGQRYTSLGRVLSERLGVPPLAMTADRLAEWMRDNPDELDEFLALNRSYIFFREVSDLRISDGPLGAAGCPLTPGRSLAVDMKLHTFGTPFWIETKEPLPGDEAQLQRLMIAQDTGSAIVGPARADIFIGSGAEAGMLAGSVNHDMDMYVLWPRCDL